MAIIQTDYGMIKPPPGCQLDYGHPINRGVVARYLFNEKGGSRLSDYSGNGNHGTLTNFAMNGATSNWVGSPMGGALNFDGTNDYVDMSTPSFLNLSGNVSFLVSLKPNTIASGTLQVMGQGSAGQFSLAINRTSGGTITTAWGGVFQTAISSGLSTDKFHNIVVTRSGSGTSWQLRYYLNGVLFSSTTASTAVPAQAQFVIGRNGATNSFLLNGVIEQGIVWTRIVSPSEVSQLYSQPNIGILSPTYYTP